MNEEGAGAASSSAGASCAAGASAVNQRINIVGPRHNWASRPGAAAARLHPLPASPRALGAPLGRKTPL